MEILEDYYLNSLSELKIDSWMYRTKGSAQVQVWHKKSTQRPASKFIDDRRYFSGMYKGREFFGKQFVKPNLPHWSIQRSVEYQFESLLLLRSMKCVPEPLFLTDNVVGMEYIKGRTIKMLVGEGDLDAALAEHIIEQLMDVGSEVVGRLRTIGRRYDCSYNNILVKKDKKIVFVDFDHVNIIKSIGAIIQVLRDLVSGDAFFTKVGQLQQYVGGK